MKKLLFTVFATGITAITFARPAQAHSDFFLNFFVPSEPQVYYAPPARVIYPPARAVSYYYRPAPTYGEWLCDADGDDCHFNRWSDEGDDDEDYRQWNRDVDYGGRDDE